MPANKTPDPNPNPRYELILNQARDFDFNFDYQGLGQILHIQSKMIEEDVLKKVLKQYLKREPTLEDAKLCTKIFRHGVEGYVLQYENRVLGTIVSNIEYSREVPFTSSLVFTFQPA